MDSNPFQLLIGAVGLLIMGMGLSLQAVQAGRYADLKKWMLWVGGLLLVVFCVFSLYRWWDASREDDRTAWQSAEKCRTPACIQAYLDDHPNGYYAKIARALLQSLSGDSTPAVVTAPTPPPQSSQSSYSPPQASPTLIAGRYRDNNDGTVTDVQTGLYWMRCALGQMWRGSTCTGAAKVYSWEEALGAAKMLNNQGGYAGYRDWRVPTREELLTLVYCSSGAPKTWNNTGKSCVGDYAQPTIDATAFPQTPASLFWSASPYAGHADGAWGVNFFYGDDYWDNRRYALHVRLVRTGQ